MAGRLCQKVAKEAIFGIKSNEEMHTPSGTQEFSDTKRGMVCTEVDYSGTPLW